MKRVLVAVAVGAAGVLGWSSAGWAVTGDQTFLVFGTDEGSGTVVATGPISGVGQDVEIPDTETDVFDFPNGDVTIDHPTTSDEGSFDPVTCLFRDRFSGTYSLRNGTGDYTGASGSGTYTGRALFVAQRTAEGCSEEPIAGFFFVRATGTTTLP